MWPWLNRFVLISIEVITQHVSSDLFVKEPMSGEKNQGKPRLDLTTPLTDNKWLSLQELEAAFTTVIRGA